MNRKIIAVLLSLSAAWSAAPVIGAPAPSIGATPPVSVNGASSVSSGSLPPPAAPTLDAKAWLLLDATSGQVIASQNGTQRVDPASLTKIMTAYLVFQALKEKALDLNQMVKVSVNAWKVAPGSSKMFIEPGKLVSVDDLLSGLLIQSGNDAAVALAEATAGAESTFIDRMNQTAAKMGLKDTHFASPHGLPDPQTYSTAQDLATLATRLIQDFPDLYVRYDTVRKFRYNNITQPNRNRLLWVDPSVDGLKTGHTEAAGYCMIASAQRPGAAGERRLIAVVMGTPSDKARTAESGTLLNWGFQNFETLKLYSKGQSLGPAEVWKGKESEVNVGFDRDVYATVPRGWVSKLQKVVVQQEPLVAPLAKDGQVGRVDVRVDGNTVAHFPVVALEPVAEAGMVGRGWDGMRLWIHGLMHDDQPPD
jgi:D-alanyl-D-alanine carboxypeptidase (penicillin-binding protein 5/6)